MKHITDMALNDGVMGLLPDKLQIVGEYAAFRVHPIHIKPFITQCRSVHQYATEVAIHKSFNQPCFIADADKEVLEMAL